jgi:hypothetical protein
MNKEETERGREQAGDKEQGDETPREEEDMRQLGHSCNVAQNEIIYCFYGEFV